MRLEGVYAAMVTPFDGAGEVDYAAFERLLNHAVDNGVAGIVPCGSTGEFYVLSDTERDEVLAFVKRTVGDRVQLIAGTNATSTRDVLTHTRHALDLGYDAALLAPPYYSLPTQGELIRHFETVLDTVDLPIVLYNFPNRAGVEIGYPVLDALASHPHLAAIKESSGDLNRLHEILARYAGHIQLVCGVDDQAFEYLAWGVTSWVAGAASFAPRPHVEMLAAMRTGGRGARPLSPLSAAAQKHGSGPVHSEGKVRLHTGRRTRGRAAPATPAARRGHPARICAGVRSRNGLVTY